MSEGYYCKNCGKLIENRLCPVCDNKEIWDEIAKSIKPPPIKADYLIIKTPYKKKIVTILKHNRR